MERTVNIIGAGVAGLSAAITAARLGIRSNLISSMPSERAQSVLAEGGINAALDTMGEHDTVQEHCSDTMRSGCGIECESAVSGLTHNAPGIVRELERLGVPFQRANGEIVLRNFGGQKKKRTAYSKSSTGKTVMTALIDEARKYEAANLITRWPHHEMTAMRAEDGALSEFTVRDLYTGKCYAFTGTTILCTGGLNGFFEGMTTGTTQNTGNAAAIAFDAGVEFANLEFVQYHPTTVQISEKRMLISEAARGEGGRLFTLRGDSPWYFMEEKYPELGNLMPRDVISREMAFISQDETCSGMYLDLRGLDASIWDGKLSDMRSEIMDYLHLDPKVTPVPVSPGIHYFMGGIRVTNRHETNVKHLYAAGEAACKYHGANRLGGNSLLGAFYGGRTAAQNACRENVPAAVCEKETEEVPQGDPAGRAALRDILLEGLSIIRTEDVICHALEKAQLQVKETAGEDRMRAQLGCAMLMSALERKESRGAHYRTDHPQRSDEFSCQTCVHKGPDGIRVRFEKAAED